MLTTSRRDSPLTIGDSKVASAGAQVFNIRECVDVVVFHVSHETSYTSGGGAHGIPANGWVANMLNLLTVNYHFFASVTRELWSYVPSFDVIGALPSTFSYSAWQYLGSAAQVEYVPLTPHLFLISQLLQCSTGQHWPSRKYEDPTQLPLLLLSG